MPTKQRTIMPGEIDLSIFYHEGAVVSNAYGDHFLVSRPWGADSKSGFTGKVCGKDGVARNPEKEFTISTPPQTALYQRKVLPRENTWNGPITLVTSKNVLPSGIQSTAPELLLVPFGPHFGRPLGSLTPDERSALVSIVKGRELAEAIAACETIPEMVKAFPRVPPTLSEQTLQRLQAAQSELVRSQNLVDVMENYLGEVPHKIEGAYRRYSIGGVLITLDPRNNRFGTLNDHQFSCLNGRKGSTNNAIDLVAAVQELQGGAPNFKAIRDGLAQHYNLKPEMDRLFSDALISERRGKTFDPKIQAAAHAGPLKAVAPPNPDEPAPAFDLEKGVPVTASPEEVERAKVMGGGFGMVESAWEKGRQYLIEERRIDPSIIDYLHQTGNLWATRRVFPSGNRNSGHARTQDCIVAPIVSFETGEIIGVDTKPLPSRPGEKTLGRNHGNTAQGGFIFGHFGEGTKRVILTEGMLKGLAFYQLHRESMELGPETCIVNRSGARPSTELVPILKKWGAEAIVANDNDYAGRSKAAVFAKACAEAGVPCRQMFVEPSEVSVAISQAADSNFNSPARAKETEEKILQWSAKNDVPCAHEPSADKSIRKLRLPNREDVISMLQEFVKEDQIVSSAEFKARTANMPQAKRDREQKKHYLRLEIHHKDWDDVTRKGPLEPQVPILLAANLNQKATPEAQKQTSSPIPGRTASPPPPPKTPSPAVWGLLLKRTEGGSTRHFIGTKETCFELHLSPEQQKAAEKFSSGMQFVECSIGFSKKGEPSLNYLVNADGCYVPAPECLGKCQVVPAPAADANRWSKRTRPEFDQALNRLAKEQPPLLVPNQQTQSPTP